MASPRDAHFHPSNPVSEPRTEAERDRDRLLHCTALRRLAEVSQVVAAQEGHVFHNRLTHVLKVSQIARGLANEVLHKSPRELVDLLGGVDPMVSEAAALCHDLGHPPFGHTTEKELDELVTNAGDPDGFEGNAQSFRIVTKLARHRAIYGGLNLTAATLNAVLKYPWVRGKNPRKPDKWGAYRSEEEEFDFARKLTPDNQKSCEAEIMDWADDIAYSVFDVEDFFRAGKMPLETLFSEKNPPDRASGLVGISGEAVKFLHGTFKRLKIQDESEKEKILQSFRRMASYFPMEERFHGSQAERGALRGLTSTLVRKFIRSFRLNPAWKLGDKRTVIDDDAQREILILKQLTWHYVIGDSSLMTQQIGFRKMIAEMFHVFQKAAEKNEIGIFPAGVQEVLEKLPSSERIGKIRTIADFIAGMTEPQAIAMYQRLSGVSAGSVLKPVA